MSAGHRRPSPPGCASSSPSRDAPSRDRPVRGRLRDPARGGPKTGSPAPAIDSFARYTRRIAISDSRLVSYDGHTVAFRWRDREHGNRLTTARLDGASFCRRFLQHVLPNRFVRIRRYGLLSNRVRNSALAQCRALLGAEAPTLPVDASRAAASLRIFGRDPERCPVCQQGRLVVWSTWRAGGPDLARILLASRPGPRAP
jgi:hypothetical protein